MKLKFCALFVVAALLPGCVTVNNETVKEMPTGYLCSLLDPNTWISTAPERSAIFSELRVRGADCTLPSGSSRY